MFDLASQQANILSLTPAAGIVAVLLIITGGLFLFAGFRLFKPVIGIAGFYFFAMVSFSILSAAGGPDKIFPGGHGEWFFLIIIVIAGLIGAALALALWRVGLGFIGAMAGYGLAVFILAWKANGLIESDVGRLVFFLVFMIIGAVAIFYFERPIIILGTSIIGANALLTGVDIFAATGYANAVSALLSSHGKYNPTEGVIGILVTYFILVILGVIVQHRLTGKGMPDYSKR